MDENDGARPRVPDEWFVGFHDGLVAQFWRAAGATMADGDDRLLAPLLDLPPGASVLDVPCGDGRLTRRLAAAGYAATGWTSPPRRSSARGGGRRRRHRPFAVGDLRALPAVGPVDAMVSWGNSFGYLLPADTARSLAGMHAVLRPAGRLVLESYTVAEALLARPFEPHAVHEYGGIRMTLGAVSPQREPAGRRVHARGRPRPRAARPRGPPRAHDRRGRAHAARRRLP